MGLERCSDVRVRVEPGPVALPERAVHRAEGTLHHVGPDIDDRRHLAIAPRSLQSPHAFRLGGLRACQQHGPAADGGDFDVVLRDELGGREEVAFEDR